MIQSYELFELISLIYALLKSEQRKKCTQYRLQLIDFEMMELLSRATKKQNTPARLANHFGMTRGTISQTIIQMEKKNLVEKIQNQYDKRIVHICLTALGKTTYQKARNTELIDQATKVLLDQGELHAVQKVLNDLYKTLEENSYDYDFKKNLGKRFIDLKQYNSIEMLDAIASLIRVQERAACIANKIQIVHFLILDYLGRCNRFSDTLSGVTAYLGMTRGTVSQSTTLLAKKNYIKKTQDYNDKRIYHIQLTEQGESLLQFIRPAALYEKVLLGLHSQDSYQKTYNALKLLLNALQKANDSNYFGICKTCIHFQKKEVGQFCQMVQVSINNEEKEKLCIEHSCA